MPKTVEALIKLGILSFKNKKFNESIKYFQDTIFLDNKSLDGYINLSNILIITKKNDEAIKLLIKGRKLFPKNIILIKNLSFLYLQINNFKSCIDESDYGLKLYPENSFLYNIKGSIFIKNQSIDEAIKNFIKSIEFKPNFWSPYENLFNALEKSNRLNKYKEYLNKAKFFFNKDENFLYFEALYYHRINKTTLSNEILLSIDKDNIKNNINNFLIKYYDLIAKNYDHINSFKEALKYFKLRNKEKKNLEENKDIDKKIITKTISQYSKYFVKQNISKYKKISELSETKNPFFLIGFPRSGTTLLDSILRSHSKITVLEEKPTISHIRDNFYLSNNNLLSSLENLSHDNIKIIQEEYFNIVSKINENQDIKNKLIIDKFPLNLIEVGFINRIFPKSKFILVLRNPCDVVLSCFVTNFKINEGMANFLEIKDAINLYDKTFKLWGQYTKELDINFHTIKYENLINNFDLSIDKLLKFIDLDWEESMRSFYITAKNRSKINTPSYNQVINPLYKKSIDRWKNYDKLLNIHKKLEKWMKDFNY